MAPTLLGMSVGEILEKFSWGGKTFLESGWNHPTAEGWDCITRKSRETKLDSLLVALGQNARWSVASDSFTLLLWQLQPLLQLSLPTMMGPQTIRQGKRLSLSDSSRVFYHSCEKRKQRQLPVESTPQAFLPGLLIDGIYVLSMRLHCFTQLNTGDWTYCALSYCCWSQLL